MPSVTLSKSAECLSPSGRSLMERFPLLEILEVSPDRDDNLRKGTLYCHSRMRSLYA